MYSALLILFATLSAFSVFSSLMLVIKLKQPVSFLWWMLKVICAAIVPLSLIITLFTVIFFSITGRYLLTLPALFSMLISAIHFYKLKKSVLSPTGFSSAYGQDWENRIRATNSPTAYTFLQDIPFCKLPATNRNLLCDLWLPGEGVERSGIAFIYFHGSAWTVLDKDFGTRPLFKHLVSQGHVIMDVAYRLFPETDMSGMVNDVYRSIAWMKHKAIEFQVNPDRIVIAGASAGAHLSLLAAYDTHQKFVPFELSGQDLSVHAVISAYGPTNLKAMYDHTGQNITANRSLKTAPSPSPKWIKKMMGKNFHRLGMDKDAATIGMLQVILGCTPEECPEVYAVFSPITYVNRNCPHTLILQGMHDLIVPVEATSQLYQRLTEEGVKAAMYLIPQTDHAFDLILPKVSPTAHLAFYLIERFLAIHQLRNTH